MTLAGLTQDNNSDFLERFRYYERWAIVGTSGMGKTTLAFSFLSQNYGMYISCVEPSKHNYGSNDFSYFMERLNIDSVDYYSNRDYVHRFMKCIIVARFIVLEHCLKSFSGFSAYDWLVLQLFPPSVSSHHDIFAQITSLVRALPEEQLGILLHNSSSSFPLERVPVFLDQATSLSDNEDRIFFSKARSLYSAVCNGLISKRNVSVCAIGTGLSLQPIEDMYSSNFVKDLRFSSVSDFLILNHRYESPEEVSGYLTRFLEIPADCEFIYEWLVGRPSFAAKFIEFSLSRPITVDSCRQFVEFMTTGRDEESIYNMIQNLVDKKRSLQSEDNIRKLIDELRKAVENFLLTGRYHYSSNMDLFEQGFGVLCFTSDCRICEPLVLTAAYHFFGNEENMTNKTPLQFKKPLPNPLSSLLG